MRIGAGRGFPFHLHPKSKRRCTGITFLAAHMPAPPRMLCFALCAAGVLCFACSVGALLSFPLSLSLPPKPAFPAPCPFPPPSQTNLHPSQVSFFNMAVAMMGYGRIPAFKTMRTLRALRPLRAMSRLEGMRVSRRHTPPGLEARTKHMRTTHLSLSPPPSVRLPWQAL